MFQIIALNWYYMRSGGWLRCDLVMEFEFDRMYFLLLNNF